MHDSESSFRRLERALQGGDGEDQRRIAEACLELAVKLLRKNSDYGSSAWKRPVLLPDMDPGAAILVRMSDKIQRLVSLGGPGHEGEVRDESWADTLDDLVAYGVLYRARPTEGRSDAGTR